MGQCKHENFFVNVLVNHSGDAGRYVADVTITCAKCDRPFQFIGLDYRMVSADGLQACLPIHPRGEKPDPYSKGIHVTVKPTMH
jgi:hypothetical protein